MSLSFPRHPQTTPAPKSLGLYEAGNNIDYGSKQPSSCYDTRTDLRLPQESMTSVSLSLSLSPSPCARTRPSEDPSQDPGLRQLTAASSLAGMQQSVMLVFQEGGS